MSEEGVGLRRREAVLDAGSVFLRRFLDVSVLEHEVVGVLGADAYDQAAGFLSVKRAGAVPALLTPGASAEHFGLRTLQVAGDHHALSDSTRPPRLRPGAAYVQLTGGTTGIPSAVVVDEAGARAQQVMAAARVDGDAVSVGWLPLHHDMGLVSQVLMPHAEGLPSVLLEPRDWLRDPLLLFDAVQQHRGTHCWMPTFGFAHCLRRIPVDAAPRDLSSLRLLGCGGERADADVLEAFARRFSPWGLDPHALVVGYGMAEAVCGIATTPNRALRTRPLPQADVRGGSSGVHGRIVSCGLLGAGLEVRVRADGHDQGADRLGQLHVRGRTLAVARLLSDGEAPLVDADGWLATGDLGFLDPDGEVYVVDRLDDCLVVAGRNVQPALVEATARQAAGPRAGRICAFGVPDGSTQALVIVVDHRQAEDEERRRIRSAVRRALLSEWGLLPKDVVVTADASVLAGSSGKTSRAATRARYLDSRQQRPLGAPLDDLRDLVMVLAQDGAADPLEAHGLDSLALLELATVLDDHGVPGLLNDLPADACVQDLLDRLEGRVDPTPQSAPVQPAARQNGRRRVAALTERSRGPVVRGHALPYPWGRAVLRKAARSQRLVERVALDGLAIVDECLSFLPSECPSQKQRALSVETNLWSAWRRTTLSDPAVVDRYVRVEGREHLQAAPAGRLVLAPHTPIITVLEHEPLLAGAHVVRGTSPSAASSARRYVAARDRLSAGGTVLLLADEFGGGGGIEAVVGGLRRPLRLGLGRLLEDTGATLVPWFPAAGDGWTYRSRFLPPLQATSAVAAVREYAGLLDAFWCSELGLLNWRILRKHLAHGTPVASPAAGPAGVS